MSSSIDTLPTLPPELSPFVASFLPRTSVLGLVNLFPPAHPAAAFSTLFGRRLFLAKIEAQTQRAKC